MVNNDNFYSFTVDKSYCKLNNPSESKITPWKITANLKSLDQLNFLIDRFSTMVSLKVVDDEFCVLALYDNITELTRLKHLQELKIKPISFFANDHCKFLVKSCPDLKSLKIVNSSITSDAFMSFVELENLEKLNLKNSLSLEDFQVLIDNNLIFPKMKELKLLGVGGSEESPVELDGDTLIRSLKCFPNLEKLVFGLTRWRDESCVDESENNNWVSEDLSSSALDLIPPLPNLSTLEILNDYFLDLRSVVRVENLRTLSSLSIPSTILEHTTLNYVATEEEIKNSFVGLNEFIKLEKLVLNFASDRFKLSTPSCKYLKELENHPSLETFTAYFGCFTFKEMEQVFHIAKGVNKIIFEASEFIHENYEPKMNLNITSLEVRNNNLDKVQDDYYSAKIYDDQVCAKKLGKSFDPCEKNNPLKKMNMAEEIAIRESIDQLKLSVPNENFGFRESDITEVLQVSTSDVDDGLVYPSGTFEAVHSANAPNIFNFRRIGTTINFFPFAKFAPRLSELILGCPESDLEKEAFREISKLPDLEKLVLGAGTDFEMVYEGKEALTNLILSKCEDGVFNSNSKVKKASTTSEENKEILPRAGAKRVRERDVNFIPDAKKKPL